MILSEEHYTSYQKLKEDMWLSQSSDTSTKLKSMLCERRIDSSLRQIDTMLDKLNTTKDPVIRARCIASIQRCHTSLIELEYY